MKFYTGRKKCGCVVFCCVDTDEDRDDIAEWLAEAVKDGLTIEHVEQEKRPLLQTCKCGETVNLFEATL